MCHFPFPYVIVLVSIRYDLISFVTSIWARLYVEVRGRRASEGPCVDPRDILGAILPPPPPLSVLCRMHILSRLTRYSRVWVCGCVDWLYSPPQSNHSPPKTKLSRHTSDHQSPCFKLVSMVSSHGSHGLINPGVWEMLFAGGKKLWLSAWSPDLFGEVGRAERWSFFGDFERRVAWGPKGPRTVLVV